MEMNLETCLTEKQLTAHITFWSLNIIYMDEVEKRIQVQVIEHLKQNLCFLHGFSPVPHQLSLLF